MSDFVDRVSVRNIIVDKFEDLFRDADKDEKARAQLFNSEIQRLILDLPRESLKPLPACKYYLDCGFCDKYDKPCTLLCEPPKGGSDHEHA